MSSSASLSGSDLAEVYVNSAEALTSQNSVHVSGSRWAAVRMPASSSITFIWSSSHSVAKILPATRNEGRPWMVLLDCLRKPECDQLELVAGRPRSRSVAARVSMGQDFHVCPSRSRAEYSREPYGVSWSVTRDLGT